MSDCLFCDIAAGAAEAERVLETEAAVAFLDRYPAARGHVVVIPRTHAASLVELPDEDVAGLFRAVKTVMRKLADALHPVGMNVGWNHGKGAGQHVLHLHVHVLPRSAPGRGVQLLGEGAGREGSLAELAETIRSA